jgi:hypothetical protein
VAPKVPIEIALAFRRQSNLKMQAAFAIVATLENFSVLIKPMDQLPVALIDNDASRAHVLP